MQYKMAFPRIILVIAILFIFEFINLGFSISSIQNIDSCQLITTPGIYQLTNDVFGTSASDTCISITSNDVNLDCNNKFIQNYQNDKLGSGIFISGVKNISIKNCNVANYSYANSAGIVIYGSQLVSIDKGVTSNNFFGIRVVNSKQIFIIEHKADENIRSNFDFVNIEDTTLRSCSSIGAEQGLSITDSESIVISNDFFSSSNTGILVTKSKNIQLDETSASFNKNGISIISSDMLLINNNISNNIGSGIITSFSEPIELKNNLIYGNKIGIEILNSKVTFNQDQFRDIDKDLSVLGTYPSPSIINGTFSVFNSLSSAKTNMHFRIKDRAYDEYSIKFVTDIESPKDNNDYSDFFIDFDSQKGLDFDLFEIISLPTDLSLVLMKNENSKWSEVSDIGSDRIGIAVKSPLVYGVFRKNESENSLFPTVQIHSSCNSTNLTLTDQKGIGLSNIDVLIYDGSLYRSELTNANGFAYFPTCGYITIMGENFFPITYASNCNCDTGPQSPPSSICPNPADPRCVILPSNTYIISGPSTVKTDSILSLRIINNTQTCNQCFLRISGPNNEILSSKTDSSGLYSFLVTNAGNYKIDLISEIDSTNPNAKILQTYSIEAQKEERNFLPIIIIIFGTGILLMLLILGLRLFMKKNKK